MAAFPALGLGHSIGLELLGWGISVLVALMIAAAVWRSQGDRRVCVALAFGAMLWLTSILGLWEPAPEAVTSAGGSLLMAGAMIWYGRRRHHRACEPECGCPVSHGSPPNSAAP